MPAFALEENNLNDRQARIVERIEQQGFVTIETLAKDFEVSAQTIRREIIRLDELGFIQRFHGGAGRTGAGERLSYEAKQHRDTELKAAIGAALAQRIQPGQSVFLDVGTTAEATARALREKGRLLVVTSSATNAQILTGAPGIDIILTGGRIVGPDLSLAGPIALDTVSRYRLDWAIIACSAIEETGAVLDFDADKIALKQRAMDVARRKALIADHGKFTRSALLRVCDLEAFDLLVTDTPPPPGLASQIGEERVIVAAA